MPGTTKRNRLALVVAFCAVLPMLACTVGGVGDDDPPAGADAAVLDCQFSVAPSVTLGGGSEQTGFVDMADGGEMSIVLGPQGLYMVTPSIRTLGLYPGTAGRVGHADDPQILIEIISSSIVVGGSAEENLGLTQTASGSERLGIFTPFAENAAQYVDQSVTLRATVSDACGKSSSDELGIIVRQ